MRRIPTQTRFSTARHRRSGLAPLEMVLLTPFLVMMGALMICFGDAALWKVRAQTAVQYAGTQTEPFRGGYFAGFPPNPRPESWPFPATMSGGGGANASSVQNLYWNQVGPEDSAALQGNSGGGSPTRLVDPYPNYGNQLIVYRQLMADRGVHSGQVSLTKQFPMLTRLLPSNGTYRINLRSEHLAGDWNYQNKGLGANYQRRAGHLYAIDPNRHPGVAGLWQNFIAAFRQLRTVPPAINYLDDDWEWVIYRPKDRRPPDFYPSPPGGCVLDFDTYRTSRFPGHLRAILNVPRRMASAWRNVYQTELNNRRDPKYIPKGPLSDGQLQNRINTLTSYLSRLTAAGY